MEENVSILDEARELQSPRQQCKVCMWLQSRPTKEQQEWQQVMEDPMIQHSTIRELMSKRGFIPGQDAVGRHRRDKHVR